MVTEPKPKRQRRSGKLNIRLSRQDVDAITQISRVDVNRDGLNAALYKIVDAVKSQFPLVVKENKEGIQAQEIFKAWRNSPELKALTEEYTVKITAVRHQEALLQQQEEEAKRVMLNKFDEAGIKGFVATKWGNFESVESVKWREAENARWEAQRVYVALQEDRRLAKAAAKEG